MDYQLFHLNYTTLKRRGCAGNYTYILTSHKYPVRCCGFEDLGLLKDIYSLKSNIKIFDVDSSKYLNATDDNVRFASSLSRSRSKVLQLAYNNEWEYFVTLTFDKNKVDRYDLDSIKTTMLKFFDNYKQRKNNDFRYLLIPEQHKNGAYHFHGLFKGISDTDLFVNEYGYWDFLPYKTRFGFCSLSKIQNLQKCANYISKYISKDMFKNVPPSGTHLYFASRNLNVDDVIKVGTAASSSFNLDNNKNVNIFDSQFCVKYYSNNISDFAGFIDPFTNTIKAFNFKNIDFKSLQYKALFDFCNNNGITINKLTNLDSLYNTLKNDIIANMLNEYDLFKEQFKSSIVEYNLTTLSDTDAKFIDALFVHNVVNDISLPPASESYDNKQLCIFDKFNREANDYVIN